MIKAQSYAVTPFSSQGKGKMEQKVAPRSQSSGQYSGPRLPEGACDLQGNSSASLAKPFAIPLQLHLPPLCTLAGLFLPGMITQKMGTDSDRWTFPFSANAAMKSEPILMNVH